MKPDEAPLLTIEPYERKQEVRMQIGITNPLREFLGWKPLPPCEEADPFYCWDAHRVKVDGRVMLVVCNAANRFAGITAMRSSDWKRLAEKSRQLISLALLDAGFSATAIDHYFDQADESEFTRTHGRKAVGCMNRMIDDLLWCTCDRESQRQPYLEHVVNNGMCHCATRNDYGYPSQWMSEDLIAHGIDPFESCDETVGDSSADEASMGPSDKGDDTPSIPLAAASPASESEAPDLEIARELDMLLEQMRETEEPNASTSGGSIDELLAQAEQSIVEEERLRQAEEAIDNIRKAMLEERGRDGSAPLDFGYRANCCICGGEPRVFLDRVPYCLSCYNELTERLMGLPRTGNDNNVLAVFDEHGNTLQFTVERMMSPAGALWTAREIVDRDNPRYTHSYAGIEVSILRGPATDPQEALSELWGKAQQAAGTPSTHECRSASGRISNGAHIDGKVLFANDTGWGRIFEDEQGCCWIVVDGRRYSGEQFLRLFSGHIGFDLRWQIRNRIDPLSEE